MRIAVFLLSVVLCCAVVPPAVDFQPFLDFTLQLFKELCKSEDGSFVLSVRSLVEQLVILQEISSADIPELPAENQDVYLSIFNQVVHTMEAAEMRSAVAVLPDGVGKLPEDLDVVLSERLGTDVLLTSVGADVEATVTKWLRQQGAGESRMTWPELLRRSGHGTTLAASASFRGRLGPPFLPARVSGDARSFLRARGNFQVALGDGLVGDFLRLPCQDRRLWMTVAVPKKNGSVAQLLDAVTRWPTDDDLRLFVPRALEVVLPWPLLVRSAVDLAPALMSIGVEGLENSEDQLANMTVDPQVTVGKVLQFTSLEFPEEAGSEGAFAGPSDAPADGGTRPQLQVDQPFLFLVSAHGFKLPLFLGKVASP